MKKIDRIHDKMFTNVFQKVDNARALMKYAYTEETEGIEEIFRFWHEKGFTRDIEDIVFFLIYISETKNISRDRLKKMLE